MRILGIETSCDETGIAVYDSERGLLVDELYSQVALHAEFGGVVPELASRDHVRHALPMVKEVLQQLDGGAKSLDAIAYTRGPGLVGALLVGASLATSLGMAWDIPVVPVHHMEAHLLAVMLEDDKPAYPFLAFLVSGGHTLLVEVSAPGQYRVLGETLDDAIGEAFDKTAKLLGLGYPGGAVLAKLAQSGNPTRFTFPRPMTKQPGLDFSFSGLKTHVRDTWVKSAQDDQTKADIARAFEDAVVDTLCIKLKRAIKVTQLNRVVMAGGVAANIALREGLQKILTAYDGTLYCPRTEFCTDNGAMVAYAGYELLRRNGGSRSGEIDVAPRCPLGENS